MTSFDGSQDRIDVRVYGNDRTAGCGLIAKFVRGLECSLAERPDVEKKFIDQKA